MVYNQEWLILQTIYVLNKEVLLKNQRFIIKSSFKSRVGCNGACTVLLVHSNFDLVSSLLVLEATEPVSEPVTQMAVELINSHLISIQQKA